MSYFQTAFNLVLQDNNAADLAASAGVSQTAISLWRTGERFPTRSNIDLIVSCLPTLQDGWAITTAYILDNTPREFLEKVRTKLGEITYEPGLLNDPAGRYLTDKSLESALKQIEFLALAMRT